MGWIVRDDCSGRVLGHYGDEVRAERALRRRKQVGTAVIWTNAGGVPKVWCSHWGEAGFAPTAFHRLQPASVAGVELTAGGDVAVSGAGKV